MNWWDQVYSVNWPIKRSSKISKSPLSTLNDKIYWFSVASLHNFTTVIVSTTSFVLWFSILLPYFPREGNTYTNIINAVLICSAFHVSPFIQILNIFGHKSTLKCIINKTEHAVHSYAAGKGWIYWMLCTAENAKQCYC